MSRQKSAVFPRLILPCMFLLAVATRPARALDPTRHITQYGHTAWRVRDGSLRARPNAIAQTADGYLWIGSETGLVRFDGVRFVPWTPPGGKQLPSPVIYSLLAARDGSLWIGTQSGLSHWVNQDLINYQAGRGVIAFILEDRNGTVWISRTRPLDRAGPLCQVIGTGMRCYGKADGIPSSDNDGGPLVEDAAGNLWMGSTTTLVHGRPGAFNTSDLSGLKATEGVYGVTGLIANPDGSLWVGMPRDGPGLGLQQLAHGVWKPLVTPGFDGTTLVVQTLFLDRENALWIGTPKQGIYRVHGHDVETFRSTDGLSSDFVYRFYQDREGNLWVATAKGIDMFRDPRVASFSTREGLSTEEADGVLASRDGTVWIGADTALDALRQGRVSSIQTGKGLPGNQVTSLFEDRAGRLWVGIDNTLSFYRDGKFSRIDRSDGSRMGLVTGIAEDVDGNIWALANRPPRVLVRIRDLRVQEEFSDAPISRARAVVADPQGGLWLGLTNGDLARYRDGKLQIVSFKHDPDSRVNQLFVDADGAVLGATAFGLIGWKSGRQQTLTSRNGLPCNGVNALVADRQGALWLYMQCGLVQIARPELKRWWEQPDTRLQLRTYDSFDGVEPGLAAFQGAAQSSDGRLWFASGGVLQMLDPAHPVANAVPPPVYVEEVIADRKRYSPRDDLRLPPLTRDIEIDYTALSFVVPQKVRFRYKLEGRDADWQEARTRRQAFYGNLRPGAYRFRAIACNNDGIWNETGAALKFSIAPAFYQTTWFFLLCLAAVGGIAWGGYRWRVRQVTAGLDVQFQERLSERTRIARELHDTLLQSFQGLMLHFQKARNQLPVDPAEGIQTLDLALDRADQAIAEGRDAIQDIRSFSALGIDLARAITALGEELAATEVAGTPATFQVSVEGAPKILRPVLRVEIYGIAREALRNAFHHARASRIETDIAYGERSLRLRIRDNGKGIDPNVLDQGEPAGHWGLVGMRERAKRIGVRLDIWSREGAGTEVEVTAPGSIAYESSSARSGFRLFRKKAEQNQVRSG